MNCRTNQTKRFTISLIFVCDQVQHSGSSHSIQNRPLPAAPPGENYPLRQSGSSSINASFASARSLQDQFHSVASTMDRTLVDSAAASRGREDDDETLADSILDSMHSCAGTEDDATLHSCAETLEGGSERDFDSPTPPISTGED